MNKAKTIRVAAVQMASSNGQIEGNLAHAALLVAEARNKGAELVLLPEFMPTGYELTDAIWDVAEPSQGSTVSWLKEQTLKHSLWIGTSFLEAVGDHFYNTFVLVGSDGKEVMRVRKARPAAIEAYFFAGFPGSHVADTGLGRIGVSICYEGFLASTIRYLHEENADFVLMPLSAPTPTLNLGLQPSDLDTYHESIRTSSSAVAKMLGVPTVMANKVGCWKIRPPRPFPPEDSTFPGLSSIAGPDGEILASLANQEGVIVADIDLNPEKKAKQLPKFSGKWARPVPKFFGLFAIAETLGGLRYRLSIKRRRMARKIADGATESPLQAK